MAELFFIYFRFYQKPHLHSELLKWFWNTYMRKRGDTDVNWILASRAESAHRDLGKYLRVGLDYITTSNEIKIFLPVLGSFATMKRQSVLAGAACQKWQKTFQTSRERITGQVIVSSKPVVVFKAKLGGLHRTLRRS